MGIETLSPSFMICSAGNAAANVNIDIMLRAKFALARFFLKNKLKRHLQNRDNLFDDVRFMVNDPKLGFDPYEAAYLWNLIENGGIAKMKSWRMLAAHFMKDGLIISPQLTIREDGDVNLFLRVQSPELSYINDAFPGLIKSAKNDISLEL